MAVPAAPKGGGGGGKGAGPSLTGNQKLVLRELDKVAPPGVGEAPRSLWHERCAAVGLLDHGKTFPRAVEALAEAGVVELLPHGQVRRVWVDIGPAAPVLPAEAKPAPSP